MSEILDYLTELFDSGLNYSTMNTARSALSCFITVNGHTLGNHPLIKRFMKGVFHNRPVFPRYQQTWDVNKVLNYLENLGPSCDLTLKDLTLKLNILILLISGQRCQSIKLLDVRQLRVVGKTVCIVIDQLVKQSRPGKAQPVIMLPYFEQNPVLCVYSTLKEYLVRTREIRMRDGASSQLFISYTKPYKPVSKDTIARWTGNVMASAGVNVKVFKPHSVRSASTSKASKLGVPIQSIMKAAGWTNACTFGTFYNKPVENNDFANAIMM